MLNHSASLAMSTSVLKALPSKLDIKRRTPSILYYVIYVPCLALISHPRGAQVVLAFQGHISFF